MRTCSLIHPLYLIETLYLTYRSRELMPFALLCHSERVVERSGALRAAGREGAGGEGREEREALTPHLSYMFRNIKSRYTSTAPPGPPWQKELPGYWISALGLPRSLSTHWTRRARAFTAHLQPPAGHTRRLPHSGRGVEPAARCPHSARTVPAQCPHRARTVPTGKNWSMAEAITKLFLYIYDVFYCPSL